ncbi:hypothetical protein Q7A53_05080 [Halobacillus rhizosphaerae]|uniref:hypothetical protein n=1 Tax=Halobacillus rhizosphaerae TaxID=3064889 RepID=UPI00398B084F
MAYQAYITSVKELRKHSNADRLQVATLFGNDVIVGLDVKVGDLGVYFPTDGKLGLEYAKENNLLRISGSNSGGYLDPNKRHITTIKLRGEKSDGLFMPIESLSRFCKTSSLKEGDSVTVLNGTVICEKYIPKGKEKKDMPNQPKKKVKDKESFPYFEKHLDTAQLAYNTNSFKEGDLCYITLKMHGTSQRTSYAIKKKTSFLNKLLKRFNINHKDWEHVTGTRNVTLKNFEGGYYGGNGFRQQWHDFFDNKLQKGESVYYEVVGYTGENQFIMPECNNSKTKDKSFIKQFGEKTQYTYGCENGKSDIYVYRMTMTNEDGHTVEYPWHLVKMRCEQMGVKYCPEFDKFEFTTVEDLMTRVKKYEDGADPIGKTHIREGIIVRVDNKEKFTAYKHKNFHFKVLESIIKADDVLDMEESESL